MLKRFWELAARISQDSDLAPESSELALSCEALEPRILLSGNVVATLIGGDLFLSGDDEANDFSLEAIDNDIVLVGNETLINGRSDDFVVARNTDQLPGNIFLNTKGGDDQVIISENVEIRHSLVVLTGQGNDSVGIAGAVNGKAIINTGSGDDTVAFRDSEINGNLFVNTGSGNDVLSITGSTVGGKLKAVTSRGNDAVVVEDSQFSTIVVSTGIGNDELVADASSVSGVFKARMGTGTDVVSMQNMDIEGHSILTLGSGNDVVISQGNDIKGSSVVVGGLGTDQVEFASDNSIDKRNVVVSSESDLVEDSIIESRIVDSPNGANPRAENAQAIFGAEVMPTLRLAIDTSENLTIESNDTLITKDQQFSVAGTASAGAVVSIDSDMDGEFDDGTTTVGDDGTFSFSVGLTPSLENNFGLNTIQVQARDEFDQTTTESIDVHLATGNVVRIDSELGSFDLELSSLASLEETVENFLAYSSRYENSIIHRSGKTAAGGDFVVQGGGYRIADQVVEIDTDASIENQFNSSFSNVRGTIAMALPSNDIDGATSQWFINMTDDNAFLDNSMFTVFGQVIGSGMDVVDQIHALPISNVAAAQLDPALNEVPLTNFEEFTESITGAASIESGELLVTGTGTAFDTELALQSEIMLSGKKFIVQRILSSTELEVRDAANEDIVASTIEISASPEIDDYVVINSVTEITSLDVEPVDEPEIL